MVELQEAPQRKVVGFYLCWNCHQQLPLYEGQKRRYCPICVPIIQKAKAGTRPNKQPSK